MKNPRWGFYKDGSEMLYSGALSVAPHNRVDADATCSALPAIQWDSCGFSAFRFSNRSTFVLTGAHDAERRVRADSPRHPYHGINVLTRVTAAQLNSYAYMEANSQSIDKEVI